MIHLLKKEVAGFPKEIKEKISQTLDNINRFDEWNMIYFLTYLKPNEFEYLFKRFKEFGNYSLYERLHVLPLMAENMVMSYFPDSIKVSQKIDYYAGVDLQIANFYHTKLIQIKCSSNPEKHIKLFKNYKTKAIPFAKERYLERDIIPNFMLIVLPLSLNWSKAIIKSQDFWIDELMKK